MAQMEYKALLSVSTGESIQTVGELRQNIKDLKKALESAEIGSEEYANALKELTVNQNALRDVMHSSVTSMTEAEKAANGVGESYNALVHQMGALRSEWRSATDVAKRNEIGAEIDRINSRLKEMDASVGNFSRNVGDYKNQMVGAFQATAGSAGGVINPLKNMHTGFVALSATPLVAVLGIVTNLLIKVVGAMSSSEETTTKASKSMAVFSAIGNGLTRVMQALANGLTAVVGWIGSLLEKVGILKEDMDIMGDIAKRQANLYNEERVLIRATASAALESAKLREKATDKLTYSAKERLKFLKTATEIEKEAARKEYEYRKNAYELIKAQNAPTKSTTEDLRKEAEAYASMLNAETAFLNKKKELNAQMTEATNAINAEASAVERANKYKTDHVDVTKAETVAVERHTEAVKRDYKGMADQIDRETARQIKANEYIIEDNERREEENYRIMLTALERRQQLIEEQLTDDPDMEEFFELLERNADIEVEIEANKHRRIKELEDKAERERDKRQKKEAQLNMARLNAATNLANGMADLLESDEQSAKKNAGVIKALRIMTTTIDTISGAVSAYKSSVETFGVPAGMIIGAANAAAFTAMGIAQVNKIRSTQIGQSNALTGGYATTGAIVNPPQIATGVGQNASITGARDEERINESAMPQRVYILSSDLEANARRVQVRESETSF